MRIHEIVLGCVRWVRTEGDVGGGGVDVGEGKMGVGGVAGG